MLGIIENEYEYPGWRQATHITQTTSKQHVWLSWSSGLVSRRISSYYLRTFNDLSQNLSIIIHSQNFSVVFNLWPFAPDGFVVPCTVCPSAYPTLVTIPQPSIFNGSCLYFVHPLKEHEPS